MNVFQWLNNPKPVMAAPDAVNPALPLPTWQITGTPPYSPPTAQARLWSQSGPAVFPSRRLVQQPAKITVIA